MKSQKEKFLFIQGRGSGSQHGPRSELCCEPLCGFKARFQKVTGGWGGGWVSASRVWLNEITAHSGPKATVALDVCSFLDTSSEKYKGTISSKKCTTSLKEHRKEMLF